MNQKRLLIFFVLISIGASAPVYTVYKNADDLVCGPDGWRGSRYAGKNDQAPTIGNKEYIAVAGSH
jgi:hypothetical protein